MEIRKFVSPLNLLLFLILLLPLHLTATNYYVSSSTGKDSNNGTSLSTPWKTLQKVELESSRFVADDVIAFKGGEQFFGTLSLSNLNGTSDKPITITSYGSGKAIITGSKPVSGWTRYSGDIWVSNLADEVFQLFRSDTVLTNGRTPELKGKYAFEDNFHKVSSVINNRTSFICNELIGSKDITGSTVHVSTYMWTFHTAKVASFDPVSGRVDLSSSINGTLQVGQKVFINNHFNLIDKEGEWYYDNDLNKLFLYSSLAPDNILANTINETGLNISNGNNIFVENLMVCHFAQDGLFSSKVNNIKINSVDFKYCYETAVQTQDADNAEICNNYIIGSIVTGIKNYNKNSIICNNTIEETGLGKGINRFGYQGGIGIYSIGENALVSENIIKDVGYNAIYFSGYNSTVEKNTIKYFHLTTSDGGGIYTYSGTKSYVKNNIITGYPITDILSYNNRRLTQCIYIDNYSNNISVIDNTTINGEIGIALTHSTHSNLVRGNKIYDPKLAGLWFTESSVITPGVNNNISEGNSILTDEYHVIPFISQLINSPKYNWFTLKNNYYFSTKGYAVAKEEWNGASYDLTTWQKTSGQEQNSTSNQELLYDFKISEVLDTTLIENGDFNSDMNNWYKSGSVASILKYSETSEEVYLYDTLYTGKTNGSIYTYSKPVQEGYDYLLEFDLKVNKTTRNQIQIAHSNGEYIYSNFRVYFKPGWAHYKIPIYNLKRDDTKLRISFFVNSNVQYSKGISLDNVKLTKCKLEPLNQQHQIVSNNSNISKSFILNGYWKDLENNTYSNTITLPAYGSKILVSESSLSSPTPPLPTDTVTSDPPPVDTIITDTTQNNGNTLGNTEIFSISSSSSNIRAIPIIGNVDSKIESISIYHNGGSGKMILAVYEDNSGKPGNLLDATPATNVNPSEGWQSVSLSNPISVNSGEKVWLAWLFEQNVSVRFTTGTPGRAQGGATWAEGLPSDFGAFSVANYTYSIYCTYTTNTSSNVISTDTIGNNEVYSLSSSTSNIRALPVISKLDAEINQISIYHNGGSGKMILAVYEDNSGKPGNLLDATPATNVNPSEGWQSVSLSNPISVNSGEKVWLAWLFEQNVSVRFTTGTPGRAQGGATWAEGLPSDFGAFSVANYTYSIYCTYTTNTSSNVISTDTIGNNEVYSLSSSTSNIRALPVISNLDAEINQVSIYHNGGSGKMILAVYEDNLGKPGNLLDATPATNVNPSEGWQSVSLSNPISVNSGEKVWLAWLFEQNVSVRFTTGTPGRAQGGATWAEGLPSDFGAFSVANYTYSIYCTYTTNTSSNVISTDTIGNNEVYSLSSSTSNIRALPVISNLDAEINQVSIYHNGGSGKMILAVYEDNLGKPGNLLDATPATNVNPSEGWQSVSLSNPISVNSGEKVWLAWLFEQNVSVRFTTGTPGRAQGGATWAEGLPSDFGAFSVANYSYSIYCTISTQSPNSTTVSTKGASMTPINSEIQDEDNVIPEIVQENIVAFPNPTRDNVILSWNGYYEDGLELLVYDLYGRLITSSSIESGLQRFSVSLENEDPGMYIFILRNKQESITLKQLRILKQ